MGLQSYQPHWLGKSKRRTQFDYAGLQHQTIDEYPWCARADIQTASIQASLYEG